MPQHFSHTLRAFAAETPRRSYLAWTISGSLGLAWVIWFVFAGVAVHATSDQARLEVAEAPSGVDTAVAGQVVSSVLGLGKAVKQGDTLVELDSGREKLLMQEEEVRMRSTTAKIEALQLEIADRKKALDDDFRSLQSSRAAARARVAEATAAADYAAQTEARTSKLAAQGVVPKVEAQKAASESRRLKAAVEALNAEIGRIESEIAAHSNEGAAGIQRLNYEAKELEGEYTAAQATISRLSLEIDRHILRAPVSGQLADVVNLHTGSHVSEGQRLALVVPEGEVQVIAEFEPSPALGRVRPGQRAELQLDGFPWAQYGVLGATVRRVDSEVRDKRIRVELGLDPGVDGSKIVQHGLPGSVAVEIEEVTPAILLLRAAGFVLSGGNRPRTQAVTAPQ